MKSTATIDRMYGPWYVGGWYSFLDKKMKIKQASHIWFLDIYDFPRSFESEFVSGVLTNILYVVETNIPP